MSASNRTRVDEGSHQGTSQLMELVVSRTNMMSAYRKVVRNDGSPGVELE